MNDFKDRVAIVTGSAQSIGFTVAEALGDAGCTVVLADIRRDRLEESRVKLHAKGHHCEAIEFDVTQEESVKALVEKVKASHGRIDILVNCAGVPFNVVPFIHTSSKEWHRIINVNLYGTFLCCREVGAVMAQQESGKIVNIASLNSVAPASFAVAYNVSKAGVASITQTLATELAPFGVNVNSISPGPIETEFHDTVMPQRAKTLGITKEAMIERIRASIPLGRWGRTSDIAKTVLFLASSQSEWMTGQNLVVAGGLSGVSAAPPKQVVRDWAKQ
jgi:NAD(P)-dependent dehydrogenase (short-subunit alcohol dehydrogenase family)